MIIKMLNYRRYRRNIRLKSLALLPLLFSILFFVYWLFFPPLEIYKLPHWLDMINVTTLEKLIREADRNSKYNNSNTNWTNHRCPYCLTKEDKTMLLDAHLTVYQRTSSAIDCPAMFRGDIDAINEAKRYMALHLRQGLTAQDYLIMTQDCETFRTSRGYFSKPMSRDEAEFPIAFSILVYIDIEQAERLLRSIYMPQNYYCIHVDIKSDPSLLTAFRSIAQCFDNVYIASNLQDVYWGHISIVHAEMSCMQDLLHASSSWRYFINLSGQMFPAHSNEQLVHILRIYDGANDVEGTFLRSQQLSLLLRQKFSWRLSQYWKNMWITLHQKSSAPHNITIYKGSNQVVLSRAFVLYFLYHPISQRIMESFADTLAADEYIWPSLNHNTHLHVPGAYQGDPETKSTTARATIWKVGTMQIEWSWKDWKCQGKWVRRICILGIGDLPWMHKRPELFINKFHQNFHWLAYDCLEELIFNRTVNADLNGFNVSYYHELSFVKNKMWVTSVNETLQFIHKIR